MYNEMLVKSVEMLGMHEAELLTADENEHP